MTATNTNTKTNLSVVSENSKNQPSVQWNDEKQEFTYSSQAKEQLDNTVSGWLENQPDTFQRRSEFLRLAFRLQLVNESQFDNLSIDFSAKNKKALSESLTASLERKTDFFQSLPSLSIYQAKERHETEKTKKSSKELFSSIVTALLKASNWSDRDRITVLEEKVSDKLKRINDLKRQLEKAVNGLQSLESSLETARNEKVSDTEETEEW